MGRSLKVYKDGTYRIWSSIPDDWVSGRLCRAGIVAQLDAEYAFNAKLKTIEAWMCFPSGWFDKDSSKMLGVGEASKFLEWQLQAMKSKNYEKLVEEKYLSVMAEMEKAWTSEQK